MGLDLVQARRQAKELLRAARSGDVQALARFRADRPPCLADAQAAVARELGFRSWPALVGGVSTDSRRRRQGTALHDAALRGQATTLRQLLARGADVTALAGPPDRPGAQEWTALDWAGWGSLHTTAASDRRTAYSECAMILLDAGVRITERTPIANVLDGVREPGLEYLPGRPVRVRVRVRGARVDVDDMGGAVAVCGTPRGWRDAAEVAVAALGWNIRRNGVVFMQAPGGRRLAGIIDRTALASAAVCDAILQIGDGRRD